MTIHFSKQKDFFEDDSDLLTIVQASLWASEHLGKSVTASNISYLIQYGRVKKLSLGKSTAVSRAELEAYYKSYYGKKELSWKDKLGDDLNWALSFDNLKETDTTKHVHRLHPYKGKFIPQLAEYFLDAHTDEFKKEVYFNAGDVVLDPFAGSGTTLVQCNELGLHAVGIDISAFNALMSNIKVSPPELGNLRAETSRITARLKKFLIDSHTVQFEESLAEKLNDFNTRNFPSASFKYRVLQGEIDEDNYGAEKAKQFLPVYHKLVKDYSIKLLQENPNSFLDKWYLIHLREEIEFMYGLIEQVSNAETQKVLSLILSRTIRSCRATTHADLATLKEPVTTTYYCAKHHKVCKPLFSIRKWWEKYSEDTIERLAAFSKLCTKTYQACLTGDSRTLDIVSVLCISHPKLAALVENEKCKGIFSSPPYVGLIDYHEQHAYAYDLFGFERNDDKEIGSMALGQGREARELYAENIAAVLRNARRFLRDDFDVFLVANDKYNLYPTIAEKAQMQIVQQYKRPVLNRTEKDKSAYSEIIFHLKKK